MNNQRGIQKRFVNDRFNLFIAHYLSFNDDKFNRVDVFVKTAQDGRIIVEVQNNDEDELMLTPNNAKPLTNNRRERFFLTIISSNTGAILSFRRNASYGMTRWNDKKFGTKF
jgi:hypothetical protein